MCIRDRYQPWQVRHLADDAVDLVLQQQAGVLGWPWPYECVQRYRLDSRGLSLTLLMINQGDAPMPFGCGIHPYFTDVYKRQAACRSTYRPCWGR